MFDVCVVGHVTRDIVTIGARQTEMPGGTAFYASLAMKSLGMEVAVVTRVSEEDGAVLERMRGEGITVFSGYSPETTTFVNTYPEGMQRREQRVAATALPFTIEDLRDIQARVFHLGPLTRSDIPVDVIAYLSSRGTVSLDAQGFLREVGEAGGSHGNVRLTDWPHKEAALPLVQILKTDEDEARALSQEQELRRMALRLSRYGPAEVIITRGARGSLIYSQDRFYTIPAFAPRSLVDPTGCGDTYMAGYLFMRQTAASLQEIGEFAARTATAKLERSGPLAPGDR